MVKHQHICDRSVFDGGIDDPRMLVYWYQQRVRTRLLAKNERTFWSACVSPVASMLRALITPAPAYTTSARRTTAAQAIF
jgi:hypothetical protein